MIGEKPKGEEDMETVVEIKKSGLLDLYSISITDLSRKDVLQQMRVASDFFDFRVEDDSDRRFKLKISWSVDDGRDLDDAADDN